MSDDNATMGTLEEALAEVLRAKTRALDFVCQRAWRNDDTADAMVALAHLVNTSHGLTALAAIKHAYRARMDATIRDFEATISPPYVDYDGGLTRDPIFRKYVPPPSEFYWPRPSWDGDPRVQTLLKKAVV